MKKEVERSSTHKGLVEYLRPSWTMGKPVQQQRNHKGYKIEDGTSGSGTVSGSESSEESSNGEDKVSQDGQRSTQRWDPQDSYQAATLDHPPRMQQEDGSVR
jgi:hypothetical protein